MQTSCRDSSTKAKARWKILAEALKKSHSQNISDVSVRKFEGFKLFMKEELKDGWIRFKLSYFNDSIPVSVKLLENKPSAEDLIGFNNTGNVCVWPSEEVLTYYCMKNKQIFQGKRICELGGGMTSLAGLILCANIDMEEVVLSDGNRSSCRNLETIIGANDLLKARHVVARQIIWGEKIEESDAKKYDYIICADCLFFVEFHEALLLTMTSLLKKNGECIIFAPHRGNTLQIFVGVAERYFHVSIEEDYDDYIHEVNERLNESNKFYNRDIHYPLLVKMKLR